MNKIIIGIVVALLVLGGIIWIARPNSQSSATTLPAKSDGSLSAEETSFDFGSISMAAGKVKHSFKIKNASAEPVVIGKMYTSCMCTTASLIKNNKVFGPYGMPGHGAIPKINQTVNPNEEVTVEVVFDPAAHGPAGVGRIERIATIENNAGQPIELGFTALVTP